MPLSRGTRSSAPGARSCGLFAPATTSLTAREQQVLALVVTGRLNKQTGGDLGIAERTVKIHRARVMEKMQVVSLAELVHVAEHLGLGLSGPRATPPRLTAALRAPAGG